ncbi:MAG: hypothetical protein KC493_16950 [Bacteriovoracaceae bacterium]|nr:hypothetical protein [Bacteriovoracaceae bacterium]
MKIVILIFIFAILFSCATPPKPYKTISKEAAKPFWGKTINEFEKICLNKKGVKSNPRLAPDGKNYFYQCEYKIYRDLPSHKIRQFSDHPIFGYTSHKYTSSSKASYTEAFESFKRYFRKEKGFEDIIWWERPTYTGNPMALMLKNGYTLFTMGVYNWSPSYQGKPYFSIKVEGFCENETPTPEEIYGRKRDIPLDKLTHTISEFRKHVKAQQQVSERAQLAHNSRLQAKWDKEKAERRRKSKRTHEMWGAAIGSFRNEMLNNKQDQQFAKAYNDAGNIRQNTKRQSYSYKPKSKPRYNTYSNTNSQKTTSKRSFSPSYNKKEIAQKFTGRATKTPIRHGDCSGKITNPLEDVNKNSYCWADFHKSDTKCEQLIKTTEARKTGGYCLKKMGSPGKDKKYKTRVFKKSCECGYYKGTSTHWSCVMDYTITCSVVPSLGGTKAIGK